MKKKHKPKTAAQFDKNSAPRKFLAGIPCGLVCGGLIAGGIIAAGGLGLPLAAVAIGIAGVEAAFIAAQTSMAGLAIGALTIPAGAFVGSIVTLVSGALGAPIPVAAALGGSAAIVPGAGLDQMSVFEDNKIFAKFIAATALTSLLAAAPAFNRVSPPHGALPAVAAHQQVQNTAAAPPKDGRSTRQEALNDSAAATPLSKQLAAQAFPKQPW